MAKFVVNLLDLFYSKCQRNYILSVKDMHNVCGLVKYGTCVHHLTSNFLLMVNIK